MDYTEFIKTELSKFRLVLNACGVVGDDWRTYMAVKMRLLKGQFTFENNPEWPEFRRLVQPLVRVRGGKIVWHGKEQGDFLAKVPFDTFDLVTEPEKFAPAPNKVNAPLSSAGKIKVCFPSDDATVFKPSIACVFQQLPERLHLCGLLFEVQFKSADMSRCYDRVLQGHIATVALYYYCYSRNNLLMREQQLPTPEPEDLEVPKVREVNKVKEPEKPNKVIRTPQRLH